MAKQAKKKKSNDATTPDEPPKPVWPPVRRHHKREPAPPTPAELFVQKEGVREIMQIDEKVRFDHSTRFLRLCVAR